MHAVIRTFPGSGGGAKLIDLLEGKKERGRRPHAPGEGVRELLAHSHR